MLCLLSSPLIYEIYFSYISYIYAFSIHFFRGIVQVHREEISPSSKLLIMEALGSLIVLGSLWIVNPDVWLWRHFWAAALDVYTPWGFALCPKVRCNKTLCRAPIKTLFAKFWFRPYISQFLLRPYSFFVKFLLNPYALNAKFPLRPYSKCQVPIMTPFKMPSSHLNPIQIAKFPLRHYSKCQVPITTLCSKYQVPIKTLFKMPCSN